MLTLSLIAPLLLASTRVNAINLDIDSPASINKAASIIAGNVAQLYASALSDDGIPGIFSMPYFWGEAGNAWDAMIRYWAITGDSTYNDQVAKAMIWQIGQYNNYLPANQTADEGNDDQSTWALAAMTAAESKFPFPASGVPGEKVTSWLQLAENVFQNQATRWDNKTCGGGLRWQISLFNVGYTIKNAPSNGNYLQLAARLAKFTGNQSYVGYADLVEQWSTSVGLVAAGKVFDAASTTNNCTSIDHIQLTENAGTYLSGYSIMANLTGAKQWTTGQSQLLEATVKTFATTPNSKENGIITEVSCALLGTCPTSVLVGRAVLARALAVTEEMSPSLREQVSTLIQTSAKGAAAQCSGGSSGTVCGSNWASSKWDGTQGLGQDLSALEMILAAAPASKALTSTTTSTSAGTTPSATNASQSTTATTPTSSSASAQSASSTSTDSASAPTALPLGALSILGVAAALIAR